MGKKRKHSDDKILRKLYKLAKEVRNKRRRSDSRCSESESESQDHDRIVNYSEPEIILTEEDDTFDVNHSPTTIRSVVTPVLPVGPVSTQSKEDVPQPAPPENKDEKEIEVSDVIPLDDDILSLLGDAPKDDSPVGQNIHADIASRLKDVLLNGLKKEIKDKLKEEYPIPGNCQLFKAPLLNPEIKAATSDILQKKDSSIAARQDQIGVVLTALTRVMDILVVDKSETNQTILKHVSNACRLLSDSHYIDTKMRRNFLISTLNNKIKDTLKESLRDKNLFGETLSEKLKATKAITKSSQDLKLPKSRPSNVGKNSIAVAGPSHLNWKHPQPNNQNRKTTVPVHRTAGNIGRNEAPYRNDGPRRQPPPTRARASAPYKNPRRN